MLQIMAHICVLQYYAPNPTWARISFMARTHFNKHSRYCYMYIPKFYSLTFSFSQPTFWIVSNYKINPFTPQTRKLSLIETISTMKRKIIKAYQMPLCVGLLQGDQEETPITIGLPLPTIINTQILKELQKGRVIRKSSKNHFIVMVVVILSIFTPPILNS